jgi:hypothetical protein
MGSTKASTAAKFRGALKITAAHKVATDMWPIVELTSKKYLKAFL